jgi:hypothetical protein
MLLLDHEIDLNGVIGTPRLAKVSWKACAPHRESVIEDDEFVALSAFGGDVPAFQENTIVGREIDIPPSRHPIVVGSLEEHASERPDDVGQVLDLRVILWRDDLEFARRHFAFVLLIFCS